MYWTGQKVKWCNTDNFVIACSKWDSGGRRSYCQICHNSYHVHILGSGGGRRLWLRRGHIHWWSQGQSLHAGRKTGARKIRSSCCHKGKLYYSKTLFIYSSIIYVLLFHYKCSIKIGPDSRASCLALIEVVKLQ